jgi:exopolysaccharide biosynthesis polyprenyl glycosylphosphotransferase
VIRRFSVNFAIFSIIFDAFCVLAALHLSAVIRPSLDSLGWFEPVGVPQFVPPVLYVFFPVLWVGVLASLSVYDGRRYIRAADEFTALSLASVLAAVSMAGILYISFREVSRAQYLLFVVIALTALAGWRIASRLRLRGVRAMASETDRRVLIVGTGPLGRMVESRLRGGGSDGVSVLGAVDDDIADGFSGDLLGRIPELPQLLSARAVTDVVVALPQHFYERIREVVSILSDKPVKVWLALGFNDLALYRTVTEDLGGLPLLDLRASALDEYERLLKRFFDLVVGSVALLLAVPIVLMAALAIGVGGGGPVFFRQYSVGENGRLFQMLKLRTMVTNAETLQSASASAGGPDAAIHKRRDDPLVTPVGRVLRRLSLDELPQLLNVLRGDMSLVGPRPELPRLVELYEPWQRQRLAVPPGMTGWWQVTGRSDKTMHLHAEDDVYYVRNYSIWLDLSILVRTVWVVLLGKGAY